MTITGPYSRVDGGIHRGFEHTIYGYRSGSPKGHRPDLYYYGIHGVFTKDSGNGYNVAMSQAADFVSPNSKAYVVAYDKLQNKLGPTIQAAMNALEYNQTVAMLYSRLIQLRRIFRAFVRRDIEGIGRAIANVTGKSHRLNRRDLLRDPSGFWLEIQFGWKPVIADIFGLIDIMQKEFPIQRVRSRAFTSMNLDAFGWCPTTRVEKIQLACKFRIKNPNLHLASSLGVINPLAVAWDAVPGSFIIDWFLPVNKFLNSLTAFAGVELSQRVFTGFSSGEFAYRGGPNGLPFEGRYWGCIRRPGADFPLPSLGSRLRLISADWWHIGTTAALVAQAISKRDFVKS